MHNYRYMADISSNNAMVDILEYASAGHTILAIKATQSETYVNPTYVAWCERAHELGLTVVHYHYCAPIRNSVLNTEAAHFWSTVKPHFHKGDYLAYDIETSGGLPNDGLILYYYKRVRQLHNISGHDPLTYGPLSFINTLDLAGNVHGHRCWIADWTTGWATPPKGCTRWAQQKTNGLEGPYPHTCAGVGRCDITTLPLPLALMLKARCARRRRRRLHPSSEK